MPDYVSVGMGGAQDLPPREWVTVRWDKEYADKNHHHRNEGGPSIVKGSCAYSLAVNVRIEGLRPGVELQARAIERSDDGKSVENGPIAEYVASQGATFVHYTIPAAWVSAGHRVRFQVIQFGEEKGRIVSGGAKALAWPSR